MSSQSPHAPPPASSSGPSVAAVGPVGATPLTSSLPSPPSHFGPSYERHTVEVAGSPLAVRYYPPVITSPSAMTGDRARGAVVIAPAMGVPQRFYAAFAGWLAERGFHVVSFDYRGSGESRTRSLREVDVDVIDWAERDGAAALACLEERCDGLPITWIGHSLGGQIVPFVPGHERLAKIITIATGSGYWKENSAALRRKVWLVWWLAVPLLTPLFGYFPGQRLGMVGDLPRGVIRQWRRWCLDPDYCVGAEGPKVRARFASVTVPLTSISFTDDEMMSAENTESLHSFYAGAPRAMKRIDPRALGLARIGHFGFFRAKLGTALWPRLLAPELMVREEIPWGDA
jgi:predicted alpha/beta hydrolase